MLVKTESHEPLLGFLGLYPTTAQDGYLGALLVTDLRGVPQEFRCSHAVKPTGVQRSLYGETLEPHIGVDLCGVRLIEALQRDPSLILVNKEFLTGVRPDSDCPVVFVRKAGEVLEIRPMDAKQAPAVKRIESTTGRFQPVVVSPHPGFEDDVAAAAEILQRASPHLDPTEPFDRMGQAVEMLAKVDPAYR